MIRYKGVWAGALAVLLAGGMAWGAEPAATGHGEAGAANGMHAPGAMSKGSLGWPIGVGQQQFETMKHVLKMTPEQQGMLKAKCDAMDQQMEEWQKQTGAQVHETMGQLQNDPDGQTKLNAEYLRIFAERDNKMIAHQAQINSVLDAKQKATWEEFKLKGLLAPTLARWDLGLSAQQQQMLEPLTAAAAKEISELPEPRDVGAVGAICGKMWKQIYGTVLTDEQMGKVMGAGKVNLVFVPVMGAESAPAGGAVKMEAHGATGEKKGAGANK